MGTFDVVIKLWNGVFLDTGKYNLTMQRPILDTLHLFRNSRVYLHIYVKQMSYNCIIPNTNTDIECRKLENPPLFDW